MIRTIVLVVACGALLGGCLRSWENYGRDLGEPCTHSSECRSGLCGVDGSGARVCTMGCSGSSGCLPGWTCGDDETCSCVPLSEVCDGIDGDCDGAIDEGGVCGCSGVETCNMSDDDCDGATDEGGVCGSCTPHPEGCNGIDDDCDGVVDDESGAAGLCRVGFTCFEGSCRCTADVFPPADAVDLLLVVDNSNSMGEEQASLTAELPRMIRVLATGDSDGDGVQDFAAPRSVHVGVVTTDMGSGGFTVPTCDRGTFGNRFGDDGILVGRGRTAIPGCMATYPSVFDFARGITDPDAFAQDVGCVANTGTGGCGFEQQLEATLKALSPASPTAWTIPGYTPPIFFESTLGHGDRENADFLRPDSALAILMVTDEEDCSVANAEVFNMGSTTYPGDLNLRCFMYPEVTHPIERFVRGTDGRSGLLGLRTRPDRLIFSVLAGVPLDSVADETSPDYELVLAHPGMQELIDPDAPATSPRLRPSCNEPGRGIAFPPRRIVRTAQALEASGARTTLSSICQASYTGAIDAMLGEIASSLAAPPACR